MSGPMLAVRCRHCGDAGVIRIRYQGGRQDDDFALCLCSAGMAWRNDQNSCGATFPLWHVWAAREQIEHDRIGPIEEWHDEAELQRMFPAYQVGHGAASAQTEDLLLAAARTRKAKL